MGYEAKSGSSMCQIQIYKDYAIEVTDGIITAVEPQSAFDLAGYSVVNARGQAVIPGFIDSHTHYLFSGSRREEFFMRAEGKSYLEIMNSGGGIQNTVLATRQASFDELLSIGKMHLDHMLTQGITTVEGKSGYGLDLDTEMKQLRVMHQLNQTHAVKTIPTFLGAHAVPPSFKKDSDGYINYILSDVLPAVKREQAAVFCDVFCEEGVFTIQQSKRLLQAARDMGFQLKIHADEITSLGGAELAASLNAVSADHLLAISPDGIQALASSPTVAVLLPCTAFCLQSNYAPARKMMDSGCAVALGSDYNPGSCHCNSFPLLLALAFFQMKMCAEEILTAVTLNGAAALSMADTLGSIEVGKQADLLILNTPDYRDFIYHTGENSVHTVIKRGKTVFQRRVEP